MALSGLFPGLGQLYNGERRKAALFFAAAALTAFGPFHFVDIEFDEADPVAALTTVLLDSLPFLAIAVWSVVDAYRSARRGGT